MIKWKQRLYALFLRRAVGPFLDGPSRQILHESIEFSFTEGTFTLNNVGLCAAYLNGKIQHKGFKVLKASVESITIQLSLVEGQPSITGEQSSLAWRAMNLGSAVSLNANVEINGIDLEVLPCPKKENTTTDTIANDNQEAEAKSVLSSYIESALESLKLTLSVTNFTIRLSHENEQGIKSWMELRLPLLSYQDLNSKQETESRTNCKLILEKAILFQGIIVSAGETGSDAKSSNSQASTIALVEGTGKISLLAVEYDNKIDGAPNRVQQEIGLRFNQQVKMSVNETSLLQIRAVVDGFKNTQSPVKESEDDESASSVTRKELDTMFSANDESAQADEKDLYTIGGIMQQYREARKMAEQNQMRGGILVPSNAYEEGDHIGEGDPRTFDVFFDANEKSFHHYSSMMKESILSSKPGSVASDFVHTKLRLQLAGGGIKLSFRGRKTESRRASMGPEEYILMTFVDLDLKSQMSKQRTEVSIQVANLEIDDAQIPQTGQEEGRVEIGNLLTIGEPDNDAGESEDLLVQPACISLHLTLDNDEQTDAKFLSLEMDLKPIELLYRARTFSQLATLAENLGDNGTQKTTVSLPGKTEGGAATNSMMVRSALCSISSIRVSSPFALEDDISVLFTRCSYYDDHGRNLANPALGLELDNVSLEYRRCENDDTSEISAEDTPTTTLDIHSFVIFVASPEHTTSLLRRRNRVFDIFAATGRLEVDPFIPITVAYKGRTQGTSVAKDAFPTVPRISTFKARQEDEDEEDAIDRMLSEKLNDDVNVDSRRAMRAQDPQAKMLIEAEKCDAVVMVHVPDIALDLSKEEVEILLKITKCLLSSTTSSESRPVESQDSNTTTPALALSVAFDSVSLSILNERDHHGRTTYSSHLLTLVKCRAYTIRGGRAKKFLRTLCHEATFFDANNLSARSPSIGNIMSTRERAAALKTRARIWGSESAAPIFHRSKLFPAISHATPSFLFDIIGNEGEDTIYLSLYDITYRYDTLSTWLERLQDCFSDLDLKMKQENENSSCEVQDDTASLTRVFVSLADCNLDYSSPSHFKTPSRSILRLGDFRISTNIVAPASSVQAYSVSVGDFSWLLCNARSPHNFENSLLPGGGDVMARKDPIFRCHHGRGATVDAVFRDMGSRTILTLESIDAILVKKKLDSSAMAQSKEPLTTISLTLGELSLYACKDSFQCFSESIGELQTLMTALTDEQLSNLKKSSGHESKQNEAVHPRPRNAVEAKSSYAPIPIDSEDDFLLDGYDWTTVDHQSGAEIPPDEEQTARWFHSAQVGDVGADMTASFQSQSSGTSNAPRIISQHFPMHLIQEPFCNGDLEDPAKLAGTASIVIGLRVLLHDMKVKIRLFDGYDWPEAQVGRKRDPKALFVISEPKYDESSSGEVKKESVVTQQNRSALLGGLLNSDEDFGSPFGDLPLPEDRVRGTLAQNDLRRLARRTSSYLQISTEGISLRVDSYKDSPEHRLKSCLYLSIKDFFVAETLSSSNPVKVFGEWWNEMEHPRDSGVGLLEFKLITWKPQSPITPENELARDECEASMTVSPMRVILDQRVVTFLKAFFAKKQDEVGYKWAANLHPVPDPFLRVFRVFPIKLKIDYFPQTLDRAALKNGSIVELINIMPLDAMVLTLHHVDIENAIGFGEAMGNLVSHWLGDICATQIHKFLTNARPFEPITNIGGGVADLFVLPWDAYKNRESVTRAVRNSVKQLFGTLAHETLTTSSRLTAFIAGEMSRAADYSHSTSVPPYVSLPSRPATLPRHVGDTAGHALESLARGVQTANYKVIIVPYREYRRSGTTGAVKSIARGIPIAIAGPVSGASEALSYTLLGVRNQIRPDIRKEEEVSQRGLHYGGL